MFKVWKTASKAVAIAVMAVLTVVNFVPPAASTVSTPTPPSLTAAVLSALVTPLAIARAQAAAVHSRNPGWITTAYVDPNYELLRILFGATAAIFLARALAEERITRAYEAARELARDLRERLRDR